MHREAHFQLNPILLSFILNCRLQDFNSAVELLWKVLHIIVLNILKLFSILNGFRLSAAISINDASYIHLKWRTPKCDHVSFDQGPHPSFHPSNIQRTAWNSVSVRLSVSNAIFCKPYFWPEALDHPQARRVPGSRADMIFVISFTPANFLITRILPEDNA